tara:strand:+ start:9566 stop:9778 length:213 start_codon:yes stop_codon:yes gene_type:complete
MTDNTTRGELIELIQKALEDFSEQQINLKSKAARDAIAFRIASDLVSLSNTPTGRENADQYFKELQRRIY